MKLPRTIFVAHGKSHKQLADQMIYILEKTLDNCDVKNFNLAAGSLIFDAIDSAIASSRWFILLFGKGALDDKELFVDVYLAITKWMKKEEVHFVFVRLDEAALEVYANVLQTIGANFDARANFENTVYEIAEHIESSDFELEQQVAVFEGRGNDLDRFMISARSAKIVFVYGVAGIGKSTFAQLGIAERIRKLPRVVDLGRGQAGDSFYWEILKRYHVEIQVTSDEGILRESALRAVKENQRKYFLVIDNGQYCLDVHGNLIPYFKEFLEAIVRLEIDTHIVINTTRTMPQAFPDIARIVDMFGLGPIAEEYIRESIKLRLAAHPEILAQIESTEMDELITLVDGHPLAALMLVSTLKSNTTPKQLLKSRGLRQMRFSWAQFILRSVVRQNLNDVETLVLHILADTGQPLTVSDLMSVSELEAHGLDKTQDAIEHLSELLLLKHEGELVRPYHSFITDFYRDMLLNEDEYKRRSIQIASELGTFAYERTKHLFEQVSDDSANLKSNASEIYRYAASASRLLRMAGRADLVEKLPIRLRGVLRELVYFYYQNEKDYQKAIEACNNWLNIAPNDHEILLYKARCYRQLNARSSLSKANSVITQLESAISNVRGGNPTTYFRQKVLREKAMIAELQGEVVLAEDYYEDAIRLTLDKPYAEVYTNYARFLISQIEYLHEGDLRRYENAHKAIGLLETARRAGADFDDHHLGLYIDVLMEVGDNQRAVDLLEAALLERPRDPRLFFKRAELYRRNGEIENAERYAETAIQLGSAPAFLTMANIQCTKSNTVTGWRKRQLLDAALSNVRNYLAKMPTSPYYKEVAAGVEAKIYRLGENWEDAERIMAEYTSSTNPYSVYERTQICILKSSAYERDGFIETALSTLATCIKQLEEYLERNTAPTELREIHDDLQEKMYDLESKLR